MRAPKKRRGICSSRRKSVRNALLDCFMKGPKSVGSCHCGAAATRDWKPSRGGFPSTKVCCHMFLFFPVHKHLKSFILCTAIMKVMFRQTFVCNGFQFPTHIMSRDHVRRSAVDRFLGSSTSNRFRACCCSCGVAEQDGFGSEHVPAQSNESVLVVMVQRLDFDYCLLSLLNF